MTQQINLFNPALRKAVDPLSALPVAAMAVACIAAIAALAGWAQWRAHQRQAELAALQPQAQQAQQQLLALTRSSAAAKQSAELEAQLAESTALLAGREEVLRVLAAGTLQFGSGYAEYLKALARQAVPELWLTGFSFADGAGELTLRGRTLDPARLPLYIKRLGTETALQGRQIAEVSLQDSSQAAPAGAPAAAAGAGPRRYTEFVLASGKAAKADDAAAGAKP